MRSKAMDKKYLKQLQDALAAKQSEMNEILAKSLDGGATPDEDQEAKVKELEEEIEVIDRNIERVSKSIKNTEKALQIAKPIEGDTAEKSTKSASGQYIQVVNTLEKGIPFAQYVRAKLLAADEAKKQNYITPVQAAKQLHYGDDVVGYIEKATLGTTTDAGFAAPLVQTDLYKGDFLELLRAATVFDKIKGYRSVPFNVKIAGQATGGTASWVGEGAAKPLTNPTFESIEIKEHKLAAIVVYTQEVLRRADPAIDKLVRDDLISASSQLIDTTFLGTQAQSATTPVGMLNGVTAITSTGVTAAAYEADLMSLLNSFVTANLSLDNSYLLMSETRAMQIALLRDALGGQYFNGMSFSGGSRTLLGIPVITSQNITDKIILVKASELLIAQDGGVDVAYSDQATLVDGATTHNLWQENKFAVRVEKFITWAKRRPIATAAIDY